MAEEKTILEKSPLMKMPKSPWIWLPNWDRTLDTKPFFSLFRKEIEVTEIPKELLINISADSRYKLYVNGEIISFGPMRGDIQVWYYDTIDIAKYLKIGKNVIAVRILRYPTGMQVGNNSIITTDIAGLYIRCVDENSNEFGINTDETWKCALDKKSSIIRENPYISWLYVYENTDAIIYNANWEREDFIDEDWDNAVAYSPIKNSVSPGNLNPRSIPTMNYIPRNFKDVVRVFDTTSTKEKWKSLLQAKEVITIEKDRAEIVEINANELMTGFLNLEFIGGANAEINIIYAESYGQNGTNQDSIMPMMLKKDRLDFENGHIEGHRDVYNVGGYGVDNKTEKYETFWFRTFRFIRLEIITKDEALTIKTLNYKETGYPLEVKTWVETSDKSHNGIWDISERSLRRCMQETYVDCPYYEQLQYIMDTRSQILFTYATSADDRLARQAMIDFQRSQHHDGAMEACFPNTTSNVISGFSIYYIFIVHDHMMYFGDKKLVRSHINSIDRVLEFFNNNLCENGLIGKIGDALFYINHKYWSFIDWCNEWKMGVPNSREIGFITMESMLYIMGLEYGAELQEYIGRKEVAKEYRERAEMVRNAIRKNCIGSNGLVQDGFNFEEYSEHCQVFGLLSGVVDVETSKVNLQKVVGNKEYAQCSVAMAFYRFRALEQAGLYELTDKCWDLWREMLDYNLTTCVENDTDSRSDCHAWGSLALYELPSVTLGVRPIKAGCEEIEVKPVMGYLNSAKGEVVTPKGIIKVEWVKVNGEINLKVDAPIGVKIKY